MSVEQKYTSWEYASRERQRERRRSALRQAGMTNLQAIAAEAQEYTEQLEVELQDAHRVVEQVQKYRDILPEGIVFVLQDLEDAQRGEEPSDDEGLEPIETSPLTEREPDL